MWLRTWILASLLTLAVGAGLEIFWRQHGHFPSVVDDLALWAEQRERVDADPNTVVLIGMSRIQMDFSSEIFHERFPERKLVRLGIPLRHVLSELDDLAAAEHFRGTVIASVSIPCMRRGIHPGVDTELAYWRDSYNWNTRLNRRIGSAVQSHVALVRPLLMTRRVLSGWILEGEGPGRPYLRTHADRSRQGDYTLRKNLGFYGSRLAHQTKLRHEHGHLRPAPLLRQLARANEGAAAIRARGGRVLFVRFPTSGGIWEQDEAYYPKARYWDAFAANPAVDALHFKDVPSLAGFDCPEGSHLDERDRERFTEALLDELERRGWLR